jgi:hypothetical protein
LLDHMAESPDPIRALSEFKPPAATAEHWSSFTETIGILRRNAATWPAELDLPQLAVANTISASDYTDTIQSLTIDNLELCAVARPSPQQSGLATPCSTVVLEDSAQIVTPDCPMITEDKHLEAETAQAGWH